jgi:hypothetical protein
MSGSLLQPPVQLALGAHNLCSCKQEIGEQLQQLQLQKAALEERLAEHVQALAAKDQQLDSTAQDLVRPAASPVCLLAAAR